MFGLVLGNTCGWERGLNCRWPGGVGSMIPTPQSWGASLLGGLASIVEIVSLVVGSRRTTRDRVRYSLLISLGGHMRSPVPCTSAGERLLRLS